MTVGACVEHGRALERHGAALLEARGELHDLVWVIDGAVTTYEAVAAENERLNQALVEAEGAADYQRERAEGAEAGGDGGHAA